MNTIEVIITVVCAVLASPLITKLSDNIFTAINNKRGKKDKLDKILDKIDDLDKKVTETELSSTRAELMMLMKDYPENWDDICTKAHHYFIDLHGDSYITTLYSQWLKSRNMEKPAWFVEVLRKEKENKK